MGYKMAEYTQGGRDARYIPRQLLDIVQMPLQYVRAGATNDHQHAIAQHLRRFHCGKVLLQLVL